MKPGQMRQPGCLGSFEARERRGGSEDPWLCVWGFRPICLYRSFNDAPSANSVNSGKYPSLLENVLAYELDFIPGTWVTLSPFWRERVHSLKTACPSRAPTRSTDCRNSWSGGCASASTSSASSPATPNRTVIMNVCTSRTMTMCLSP